MYKQSKFSGILPNLAASATAVFLMPLVVVAGVAAFISVIQVIYESNSANSAANNCRKPSQGSGFRIYKNSTEKIYDI